MRILILANMDMGLYKFRRELLEELVKKNEVYFCVPNGEFIESIKKLGCKFIECSLLDRHGINPIKELKLIFFYRKIICKLKPNIVFTYTIKSNAYGGIVCASLGVPYVVNITGLGTSIENGGLMQKISLFLYTMGVRKAQKVFFQNTENRDFMISNGVINGSYDMLPGSGVNLTQYKVVPYPKGSNIDFVFIARVMKEKGIDQYLEAAKEIRKKHHNVRFHVCGFCEENYEKILKELNDNGTIIYHGLVTDMTEIYRMSSCTVHPTYYPEGLSNVLLESAASGRPIITTDRAGCREVVDDGVNGYIVQQKNSQDLIEKIESFLRLSFDEKREMGIKGRLKVEHEFDRKIVVEKYLSEVRKIAN
ncbi:MAG: glycosyltransferase family 4 protein [Selenomonas ruminantium]|nr:glycosyltransferase family 4 protein [Selenomonas ruminantium]